MDLEGRLGGLVRREKKEKSRESGGGGAFDQELMGNILAGVHGAPVGSPNGFRSKFLARWSAKIGASAWETWWGRSPDSLPAEALRLGEGALGNKGPLFT